jgi:hypothetical protein
MGETGFNEVWALSLTNGATYPLGCSLPSPFGNRLAWSSDSAEMAYTLVAGSQPQDFVSTGCTTYETTPNGSDAWIFLPETAASYQSTHTADAFAAAYSPDQAADGVRYLWVSHAAEQPWSELVQTHGGQVGSVLQHADGVFLPLPSGQDWQTLFYRPVLARDGTLGNWVLQGGGIPLIGPSQATSEIDAFTGVETIDPGTAGSSLVPWQFTWSADGNTFAVWVSSWNVVFVGHASTPEAVNAQEVTIDMPVEGSWVADAAVSPDGANVLVTIGIPSAGIGDPVKSQLVRINLGDGSLSDVGPSEATQPWIGPAVFGR